jgi:hypothetical protein
VDFVAPAVIPEDESESFYLALGKSFNRYNFRLGQALKVFEMVVDINPRNTEARYYIDLLKKELHYTPDEGIKGQQPAG